MTLNDGGDHVPSGDWDDDDDGDDHVIHSDGDDDDDNEGGRGAHHIFVLVLKTPPAALEGDGSFFADLVPSSGMKSLAGLVPIAGASAHTFAADLAPPAPGSCDLQHHPRLHLSDTRQKRRPKDIAYIHKRERPLRVLPKSGKDPRALSISQR
jgi:hypothetical protein